MKKLFLLAALALPLSVSLTGCSSDTVSLPNEPGQSLPKHANAVVNVSDGGSSVTVTKTVDATTQAVKWAVGTAGSATFTFNSLPGSDAINIVGYRIVKDEINGEDVTPTDTSYKNIFVYVQSGYTCGIQHQADLAAINQSCDPNVTTATATQEATTPGTGITSTAFSLNLSGGLVDYAISTESSVYRATDVEFLGVSARNEKIIITAHHVVSQAQIISN